MSVYNRSITEIKKGSGKVKPVLQLSCEDKSNRRLN